MFKLAVNNLTVSEHEAELNYIIEISRRAIDLSLSMYFKALKKNCPLLTDKIIKDENNCCIKQVNAHLINNTDVGQLIKEVEEQVNDQLKLVTTLPVPRIKFSNIDIDLASKNLNEFVNEEKNTLKTIKYADKTANQISGKIISNIAPKIIAKRLTACCAKTITNGMGINVSEYNQEAKNLVARYLTSVLEGIELDLKKHLKYQLAEQLYNWFDQDEAVSAEPVNYYA